MTDDLELEQWRREWQAQDEARPDVDQLRRLAERRNRREKLVTLLELLLGAAALVICTHAYFIISNDLMRLGTVLLGLIVLAATARGLLLRRRSWRSSTLNVSDLLTLERQRLDSRIRWWRESAWVVTALWCALAIVAVVDTIRNPDAASRLEGWYLSLAVNAPIVVATAALAWRTRRRARAQRQLLDELEDPSTNSSRQRPRAGRA